MFTLKIFRLLFLFILFLLIPIQTVQATEYTVSCNADNAARVGELIAAINSANSSPEDDTINLAINCTYTLTAINNTMGDEGGNGLPAILNNGALSIGGYNTIIERSRADGTPLFRLFYIDGADLTLAGLILSNGRISQELGRGGGFLNVDGFVDLINVRIYDNFASSIGGGFSNEGTGRVTMFDTILAGNQSGGAGGGFANYNGNSVTMNSSILVSNQTGGDGGGFWNTGGTVNVNTSSLDRNRGGITGGAFSSYSGTVHVNYSALINNDAEMWGGGFWNYEYSTLTMHNSTLGTNKAGSSGGAFTNRGTATLINNTLSGNFADHNYRDDDWRADGFVNDGVLSLKNNIINSSSMDCVNHGGTITGSYNLLSKICINVNPSDTLELSNTHIGDAMLGPLTGDIEYFPLMAFSPAIDAGSNTNAAGLTTDQAGNSRFYDDVNVPDTGEGTAPIVDIGAVERQMGSPDLPTISINNVTLTEGTGGIKDFTFTVQLVPAYAAPVTVEYRTSDGSATIGSDYTAHPPTTLIFEPGEMLQQITVTVNSDAEFEPDETFTVELSNPTNAILATLRGTGTILNDDEQPPVELPDLIPIAPEVPESPAIPLPLLINPLGYTSQNPVILLWIGPPNALQYRVLVQKQADRAVFFEETLSAQLCNGNMCEMILPFIPAEDTPYVWLVRVITAEGLQAPSMEGSFIYIPAPPAEEITLPGEIVLPGGE